MADALKDEVQSLLERTSTMLSRQGSTASRRTTGSFRAAEGPSPLKRTVSNLSVDDQVQLREGSSSQQFGFDRPSPQHEAPAMQPPTADARALPAARGASYEGQGQPSPHSGRPAVLLSPQLARRNAIALASSASHAARGGAGVRERPYASAAALGAAAAAAAAGRAGGVQRSPPLAGRRGAQELSELRVQLAAAAAAAAAAYQPMAQAPGGGTSAAAVAELVADLDALQESLQRRTVAAFESALQQALATAFGRLAEQVVGCRRPLVQQLLAGGDGDGEQQQQQQQQQRDTSQHAGWQHAGLQAQQEGAQSMAASQARDWHHQQQQQHSHQHSHQYHQQQHQSPAQWQTAPQAAHTGQPPAAPDAAAGQQQHQPSEQQGLYHRPQQAPDHPQRSPSMSVHMLNAALPAPQQQQQAERWAPAPSSGPDTPSLQGAAATGAHNSPGLHSGRSWPQHTHKAWQHQQHSAAAPPPPPVRTQAPPGGGSEQLLVLPEGSLALAGGGVEFTSAGACVVNISPAASPTARSSPGALAWRDVHKSVPWSC